MLARAGGFWLFWRWTQWHYRFRWLIWAYAVMAACFATILLGNHLWLLVAAQVGFGVAVSLIYYSSLYYSMDVGDTKGEHGGFHEAAIGAGIFGGPALGALSLYFFQGFPNMNTWAVGGLLAVGFVWLVGLRRRGAGQSV
jgi:predicted MFS family arabinose efflux permease